MVMAILTYMENGKYHITDIGSKIASKIEKKEIIMKRRDIFVHHRESIIVISNTSNSNSKKYKLL